MIRLTAKFLPLLALLALAGCATTDSSSSGAASKPAQTMATAAELNANPPEYWLAQRTYYPNRMCWGYIKRPEQDWRQARLILMKEDKLPAPHRGLANPAADNNFQYKLWGRFQDHRGYDPVMNRVLDVFVLEKFENIGIGPAIAKDAPLEAIPPMTTPNASNGPAAVAAERERARRAKAKRSSYEDIF